ncbi:MAG: hypothetical protein H6500_00115 [Candidatus Woesearchaeota archaeon]|nr:MAG: hypothetical protein H6500_00115 [Candidatus Woesearchaeota archaeon]
MILDYVDPVPRETLGLGRKELGDCDGLLLYSAFSPLDFSDVLEERYSSQGVQDAFGIKIFGWEPYLGLSSLCAARMKGVERLVNSSSNGSFHTYELPLLFLRFLVPKQLLGPQGSVSLLEGGELLLPLDTCRNACVGMSVGYNSERDSDRKFSPVGFNFLGERVSLTYDEWGLLAWKKEEMGARKSDK